jgi:hypothetical protein
MPPDSASPDDPPPIPPQAPDPADCCGEGCVRCVYDVYEASLEHYRTLLEAWRRDIRTMRMPTVPHAEHRSIGFRTSMGRQVTHANE